MKNRDLFLTVLEVRVFKIEGLMYGKVLCAVLFHDGRKRARECVRNQGTKLIHLSGTHFQND
jgi:hypothetical protein